MALAGSLEPGIRRDDQVDDGSEEDQEIEVLHGEGEEVEEDIKGSEIVAAGDEAWDQEYRTQCTRKIQLKRFPAGVCPEQRQVRGSLKRTIRNSSVTAPTGAPCSVSTGCWLAGTAARLLLPERGQIDTRAR